MQIDVKATLRGSTLTKSSVCSGQQCSATINTKELANITMPKSNRQSALLAIEKVLTLLRSVKTLEGTGKDGVEHFLQMAVDNLKN